MTVRVNVSHGDGTYYLADLAHELDGLRDGSPGRVMVGPDADVREVLDSILGRPASGTPVAYDVIVAAPKPVSLLLAIEPPGVARRVVEAHERSVAAALEYLVDEGIGARTAPSAVGFTHGVNRHLDPHLHTHVLVGAPGPTGQSDALDAVRTHASAADALYLAELRGGVREATGRTAWLTAHGRTVVDGVDYALVADASAPRERDGTIERSAVKPHPTRAEVQSHWSSLLSRHDPVGPELVAPACAGSIDEYRFARALGTGLVARRDVVRAWAQACTTGEGASTVRRAVSLASGVGGGRRPAVLVRDDVGVRVLGPRPRDLDLLGAWHADRAALTRYLEAGHSLSHALDPTGAPAATRLALATFGAARADRARSGPTDPRRALEREGRSVS